MISSGIRGRGRVGLLFLLWVLACIQPVLADSLDLGARIKSGKLELFWNAVIGRSYMVERTTNLTGTWSPVATVVADAAAETWSDPDALTAGRWYRLRYDDQPGNLLFALPDGDFEFGVGGGVGWFQGTPIDNSPRIVQAAPPYLIAPRSGNHFAVLGGYHNLDFTTPNHQAVIQYKQAIQLPLQPVYLHVWYQLISAETDPAADVFNLWLSDILATGPTCNTNALVTSPSLLASGNTNGWTRISIDLTPWAGRLICLALEVRTNFVYTSTLFLDDISFRDAP